MTEEMELKGVIIQQVVVPVLVQMVVLMVVMLVMGHKLI